jgi:transposase-like protein
MLTTFVNALMSAEADAVCGAPYGMPGPDRVDVHNGYRHRDFDTRAGTPHVTIPKLPLRATTKPPRALRHLIMANTRPNSGG